MKKPNGQYSIRIRRGNHSVFVKHLVLDAQSNPHSVELTASAEEAGRWSSEDEAKRIAAMFNVWAGWNTNTLTVAAAERRRRKV